MAITWVIIDDRFDRLVPLVTSARAISPGGAIYVYWMAVAVKEESQADWRNRLGNVHASRVETLELPTDVTGPCILLLDYIWSVGGVGQYNSDTHGPTVREWLDADTDRLAFNHSSGETVVAPVARIAYAFAHDRFLPCPGQTTSPESIVKNAFEAYESLFGIDTSVDVLMNKFFGAAANHDPTVHVEILERMLSIKQDDRRSFYQKYTGDSNCGTLPTFSDNEPDLADPIYNGIKELSAKAISMMAAWLLIWAGMRTRLVRNKVVHLEAFDTACCEALCGFRGLGLDAKTRIRYDFVAGRFTSEEKLARCLKLLFRIGYDLVLSDRDNAYQFNEVTLDRDHAQVSFRLKASDLVGQLHHVVDPLCATLEGNSTSQSTVPGNKATIRRIVTLNTLLGLGGDDDISARTFCSYFKYENGAFSIGFSRLPDSRQELHLLGSV